MSDERILREKAREAIRTARLPARKPDRKLGGLGTGSICTVCGEFVTLTQMEFEVEFKRGGSTAHLERYRLHRRCFAAWEFERGRSMTDDEIRARVKATLANGSLPRQISTASWRGKTAQALSVGSALPNRCIVCDESRTQFRYNVQRIAFHARCRDIWEAEGGKVTWPPDS